MVEQNPELLNGIKTIRTTGRALGYTAEGKLVTQDAELTMIPYYAWAHRGQGEMIVWLPSQVNAVRPMNNIDTSKTEGVGTFIVIYNKGFAKICYQPPERLHL